MSGLINWRKVAPPIGSPDTAHVYVGVDVADCKLYIKDDTGAVFKYETSNDVATAIATALANYDLSTVVDSKIAAAINDLIDGAGTALDTLNELADALGNDPNFATTVTNALALKANTADLGDLAFLDTVSTTQIDNDAVTNAKLATNAVTAVKINNNSVLNSKLFDMPTLTIKGNDTGATADPKDLTVLETKTMLALENLDNTSDANKPVSTAQATAIATAVTNHESASDPHPQYLTSTEGNAAYQPLDGDLTAVAGLAGAGFAVRTTTNTWATRSLTTPPTSGRAITNQDGVFGSPSFTYTDKGSDAVATHVAASDPHPQYLTPAEGNAAYQPLDADLSAVAALTTNGIMVRTGAGTVATRFIAVSTGLGASQVDGVAGNPTIFNADTGSAAVSAHVALADPHPQYTTAAEASAAAPVQSVAGKVGVVTLVKADVGLGLVDNTSDLGKPISTATQTALNLKYDATNPNGYQTAAQVTSTVNAASTTDRDRANHTGTQLSSTVSDFAATVRSTVLTGLSTATNAVITATDTVLSALGKLQAQLSQAISNFNASQAVQDTRITDLETSDAQWIELVKTSGDTIVNSNVTLTNQTDLQFSVVAGRTYYIEMTIRYRSAATTTGFAITIGTPNGAAGVLACQVNMPVAADGTAALYTGSIFGLGDVVTATGTPATTPTDFICNVKGVFECTTSGLLLPQFRSEVNGSNVNFRNGSIALIREF